MVGITCVLIVAIYLLRILLLILEKTPAIVDLIAEATGELEALPLPFVCPDPPGTWLYPFCCLVSCW